MAAIRRPGRPEVSPAAALGPSCRRALVAPAQAGRLPQLGENHADRLRRHLRRTCWPACPRSREHHVHRQHHGGRRHAHGGGQIRALPRHRLRLPAGEPGGRPGVPDQLRDPHAQAWNGRFFHQGNGGIDGAVVTATGSFSGGPLTNALLPGASRGAELRRRHRADRPRLGWTRRRGWTTATRRWASHAGRQVGDRRRHGKDRTVPTLGGCSNGGRHAGGGGALLRTSTTAFSPAPGFHLPLAAW